MPGARASQLTDATARAARRTLTDTTIREEPSMSPITSTRIHVPTPVRWARRLSSALVGVPRSAAVVAVSAPERSDDGDRRAGARRRTLRPQDPALPGGRRAPRGPRRRRALDRRHRRSVARPRREPLSRGREVGFNRSHGAVLRQVLAVVDPEAEDESTAGPDSALAARCRAGLGRDAGRPVRPGPTPGSRAADSRSAGHRAAATMTLITTITGLDPEARERRTPTLWPTPSRVRRRGGGHQ